MKEPKSLEEDLKDLLVKAAVDAAINKKKKDSELTPLEKYLKEIRDLPDLPEHNEVIE